MSEQETLKWSGNIAEPRVLVVCHHLSELRREFIRMERLYWHKKDQPAD